MSAAEEGFLNPLKKLVAGKGGTSVATEALPCAGGPSACECTTRADRIGGRRKGVPCRR